MKFSFLFLFLIVTPLFGAPAYPFVDQNQITGIRGEGTKVIFETTHGEKIYDTVQKTWDFKVFAPPGPFPEKYNSSSRNKEDICPFQSDQGVTSIWHLKPVANSQETDVLSYELSNSTTGKKYNLPVGSYLDKFIIFRKHAWFWDFDLSKILCLNLNSRETTYYVTWPLFPIHYAKVNKIIYFLNSEGLFFLDNHKIQNTSFGPGPKDGRGDILAVGNKLYILSGSLSVYDTEKDKASLYPLPVRFADHLLIKDETLTGYGWLVVDDRGDGGEGNLDNSGGAFSFSLKNSVMKKLTDLPIFHFDIKTMKAKSVRYENEGYYETEISYSNQKKEFLVKGVKFYPFSEPSGAEYQWKLANEEKKEADQIAQGIAGTLVEYQTQAEIATFK